MIGCDTFVALAPAARDGVTLFAKNSDRPPRECQRVVQVPRAQHPAGTPVRCQYVEVPQVTETAGMIGSQPWWLWGFEHGVNEHGVAIGNETVFAKEGLGPEGLLGMDLVRLGLERARSADEALHVMTALLETHGQGGSGHAHVEWPYHNGFLIADPRRAWILETSGRHWVAKRVRDVGHVSNGLSLRADWDRSAADATSFAVAQGWWPSDAGPVDFAAAYVDTAGVPPNICAERRRRAAALLGAGCGRLTPAALRAALRDHHDDGPVRRPRPFDDPHFFTLCMHADPLDDTTASMVASLRPERAPSAIWVSLGSPCIGAFVPVYLAGTVPAVLGLGGAEPDAASPWWRTRELLARVEGDLPRWTPLVRARFDPFEAGLEREAAAVEADAEAAAQPERAAAVLTAFMESAVRRWLALLDALLAEIPTA